MRDDDAGARGRRLDLRPDDLREDEVAERAARLPALEPLLGNDAFRPRAGLQPVQSLEPVDAREPVARLPALLRRDEVPGEHAGVPLAEAEAADPFDDLLQHAAPYSNGVPAALQTRALAKRYGTIEALRGVELEVGEGELVGLLGPNGAGKSTLVKIAVGLVHPTGGDATVCGAPAGSAAARASLGYLAELFRFPGWYSADEVLLLHQRLAGSEGGEAERTELLRLVGLLDARGRKVDAMSKGMQQRLGIAQALVGSPRILLLDEPTSALDPAGRRTVRRLLEELRARGVAVLLNSHLLSEVELVCDRVVIITGGSVVAAGTPAELSRARGVEIETAAGLREFPDATRDDAPGLVAELVAAGERIYEVRVRRTSLEETYLHAVGEDAT